MQSSTRKRKMLFYLFAVLLAVAIMQLTSFAEIAKINGSVVNVRSGPGLEYEVMQKISKNDRYPILDRQEEWVKIDLGNNQTGWVADWLIDIEVDQNQIKGKKLRSMVNILNVRAEPSTNSDIIGKISTNSTYEILDSHEDWIQIQFTQEKAGWVFSQYAEVVQEERTDEQTGASVKIITQGTNLRSGPSIDEKVLLQADEGDIFPILEKEGDWYKIQLKDGNIAYVAGWVVSTIGLTDDLSPVTSNALKGKVIVVDAGHGGKDQGSEGIGLKTKEKVVNLQVANLLAKKLESAGAKVVMTRKEDSTLTLQKRVDISINNNADAFVSIHHNTFKSSSMNGTITFYYSEKKDKNLADYIQAELTSRNGLKDLGTRYGNYFVLRENPQPAVLVELGFLSNRNEELMIRTKDFQENSAEGIYMGIVKYFASKKK